MTDHSGHKPTELPPVVSALRAARVALGWTQNQPATASGVSKVTIARLESGVISSKMSTVLALQTALERAGAQTTLNDPVGGYTLRVRGGGIALNPREQG